jgi:glycogen phosphorylase
LHRHRRTTQSTAPPPYFHESVLKNCIFTTHTPVEAAQDRFPYNMFVGVLGNFIELEELKRYAGPSACNMTQLALNLSGFVNGVSRRDAQTTRQFFPGYRIRAITNGVHTESWSHRAFARIFNAHFPHWPHDPDVLAAADRLPDDEIWTAHGEAKAEPIAVVKERTGRLLIRTHRSSASRAG